MRPARVAQTLIFMSAPDWSSSCSADLLPKLCGFSETKTEKPTALNFGEPS